MDRIFSRPVPYPINEKKNLTKNPLNYYSLKVTKFHGDSVKNESARTKKTTEGAPNAPPLFRVKRRKFTYWKIMFNGIFTDHVTRLKRRKPLYLEDHV